MDATPFLLFMVIGIGGEIAFLTDHSEGLFACQYQILIIGPVSVKGR